MERTLTLSFTIHISWNCCWYLILSLAYPTYHCSVSICHTQLFLHNLCQRPSHSPDGVGRRTATTTNPTIEITNEYYFQHLFWTLQIHCQLFNFSMCTFYLQKARLIAQNKRISFPCSNMWLINISAFINDLLHMSHFSVAWFSCVFRCERKWAGRVYVFEQFLTTHEWLMGDGKPLGCCDLYAVLHLHAAQ